MFFTPKYLKNQSKVIFGCLEVPKPNLGSLPGSTLTIGKYFYLTKLLKILKTGYDTVVSLKSLIASLLGWRTSIRNYAFIIDAYKLLDMS